MANEKKMVTENIRRYLLKEYMQKETARAGFGGLDIQRTPMGTRVTLITERPGIVIGRRGAEIKRLTNAVENQFAFDNPQIEVQEVKNPYLNAQIMAEKLANALERGWHFRRAGHSTVRNIMRARAKGVQVILSGKLTGQRHRMEKFKAGHIKFCGEPKIEWMNEGFATAMVKLGTIGVKVQIMDPKAKLPDEINILDKTSKDVEEKKTDAEKKVEEKKTETEEKKETTEKVKKEPSKAVRKAAQKAKNLKKMGVDIDLEEVDEKEVDLVKSFPPKGDEDLVDEDDTSQKQEKKPDVKPTEEKKADAKEKAKPSKEVKDDKKKTEDEK